MSATGVPASFEAPSPLPVSATADPAASTASSSAVDTTGVHYELLSAVYGHPQHFTADPSASLPEMDPATIWLARAIYSETKLPHEQELVAWVIRNRVETAYRGKTTYRSVILDPYQFSAFNPSTERRSFFMNLTPEAEVPGWQQALNIAHFVRNADPQYRPFSINTRHFFSQRSMPNEEFPYWVGNRHHVSLGWNYSVDARRFRFYEKVS